jgi:subtilisin family serine protease
MKALLRCLVALAGLACAATVSAQISPVETGAAERQILVMIRDTPVRHYLPNAGYGADYGKDRPSAQTRNTAEALANTYRFRLVSDWAMPAIGVRCFLAEIASETEVADIVSRLSADPRVESAQPIQVFHLLGHTDDYAALQSSARQLQLDQLHKFATGRRVRVAQIDTGVETSHPDLKGQLSEPVNLVDGSPYAAELHGTEVAGIIVARADDGQGIIGIAPGATLMPLRACWEQQQREAGVICTSFTLAKAIQYAIAKRAQILNLSLSGPRDRLLERLIEKAVSDGMVVVAAVDPQQPAGGFPASMPQVIGVAASGTGLPEKVVLAPGDRVLTTTPNASWGFASGNSFAAAHVSGIAALLLEAAPSTHPGETISLLRSFSRPTDGAPGAGRLNACALLTHLAKKPDCNCCDSLAVPLGPGARAGRSAS